MLVIQKRHDFSKGGRRAALLLFVALGALMLTAARKSESTTILIVRHAEKQANAGDDPHLSDAGVARAQALARAVEHANVDVIYVSQYLRTKETAGPLAARQIPVIVLPVGKPEEYPKLIVNDILTRHSGKTVLVVSHSNIVPGIVEELTHVKVPEIADDEYSRLYIVTVQPGRAPQIVAAQYGFP
jgi:broad specificity phosphatase PhoE